MYFVLFGRKIVWKKIRENDRAWHTNKSVHFNGCLSCELSLDSSNVCYNKDTNVNMHTTVQLKKIWNKKWVLILAVTLKKALIVSRIDIFLQIKEITHPSHICFWKSG